MSAFSPQRDRVDRVMRDVARVDFLPPDVAADAHVDAPLPIGHGQTNSQPFTVATMLRLLEVRRGGRVLDVGSGSGWTTALLARLVGEEGVVIGTERHQELIDRSQRALASYAIADNARIVRARTDVLGAPEHGPFDRILVSAQAAHMPTALTDQLADGGTMVVPVAGTLYRVDRSGERFHTSDHGAFAFVPLVEGE